MTSTPSKGETSLSNLTPVRFLDSPNQKFQADQILTSKTRFDEINKTMLNNFAKWQIAQKRGQSLCNSIEAIKSKCLDSSTTGETLFPEELKPACDKLAIILTVFEDIVENTKVALSQLHALAKMAGNSEETLYRTWFVQDFVQFAVSVLEQYQSEYAVKQFITEEIAHCQERCDLVRLSSFWEYPMHVDDGVKVKFLFLAEEIRVK